MYADGVRQSIRDKVNDLVKTKPKELLGTEMIFELATSIQDILEDVAANLAKDVPTLNEERAIQEAAAQKKAQARQEEKVQQLKVADEEEDRMLSQMIEREHARLAKLQSRSLVEAETTGTGITNKPGALTFDHQIKAKNSEGTVVAFRAVNNKTLYVAVKYELVLMRPLIQKPQELAMTDSV